MPTQILFNASLELQTDCTLQGDKNEKLFPQLVWCEILDKIILRDKCLQKFKAFRHNIDEQMYKEAKMNVQKLIKTKKRFLPRKIKWVCWLAQGDMKTYKSIGVPSEITPVSQISLKDEEKTSFDEKTNNNSFTNFYANLALNLVYKPPHADSVLAYYERFLNTEHK